MAVSKSRPIRLQCRLKTRMNLAEIVHQTRIGKNPMQICFRPGRPLRSVCREKLTRLPTDIAEVIQQRIFVSRLGLEVEHSIGQISRTQRVRDNDAEYVEPLDMLAELADDNRTLAARLREAHNVCDEHRDVATASLIEVWIDETERRAWFLFEATRQRN